MTGVSLILPIGFVPFVFSTQLLLCLPLGGRAARVPRQTPSQPFGVLAKWFAFSAMTDYVSSVFLRFFFP